MLTPDTVDAIRRKIGLLELALEGLEARSRVFERLEWETDLRPINALVNELAELVRASEAQGSRRT